MRVAEAVELVRRVGAIKTSGDRVKLRFPEGKRAALQPAIDVLQRDKAAVLALLAEPLKDQITSATRVRNDLESPEVRTARHRADGLKGTTVEIWADSAGGRVWIVADEEDARLVKERFGAARGETWTREEIELVARIEDRAVAQELAAWKRRFNGTLTDTRNRNGGRDDER